MQTDIRRTMVSNICESSILYHVTYSEGNLLEKKYITIRTDSYLPRIIYTIRPKY